MPRKTLKQRKNPSETSDNRIRRDIIYEGGGRENIQ